MKRLPAYVREQLQRTQKDAPHAVLPTREELLEALANLCEGQTIPRVLTARRLLQQDAQARAWLARRDALRHALVAHYGTASGHVAVACHCRNCQGWRAELERLLQDGKPE